MESINKFLNDAGRYIFKAGITLNGPYYREGRPVYQVSVDFGAEILNIEYSCYSKTSYHQYIKKGHEDKQKIFSSLYKRQKSITKKISKTFKKHDQAIGYSMWLKNIFKQNHLKFTTTTNIPKQKIEYAAVTKENILLFLNNDACPVSFKKRLVTELSNQNMCYPNDAVKRIKRDYIRNFNYNIHKYILRLFKRVANKKKMNTFLRHLHWIDCKYGAYKDKVIEEIFNHIHNYDDWICTIKSNEDARIASKYLRKINMSDRESIRHKKLIKMLKATDYLNETLKTKHII